MDCGILLCGDRSCVIFSQAGRTKAQILGPAQSVDQVFTAEPVGSADYMDQGIAQNGLLILTSQVAEADHLVRLAKRKGERIQAEVAQEGIDRAADMESGHARSPGL